MQVVSTEQKKRVLEVLEVAIQVGSRLGVYGENVCKLGY